MSSTIDRPHHAHAPAMAAVTSQHLGAQQSQFLAKLYSSPARDAAQSNWTLENELFEQCRNSIAAITSLAPSADTDSLTEDLNSVLAYRAESIASFCSSLDKATPYESGKYDEFEKDVASRTSKLRVKVKALDHKASHYASKIIDRASVVHRAQLKLVTEELSDLTSQLKRAVKASSKSLHDAAEASRQFSDPKVEKK